MKTVVKKRVRVIKKSAKESKIKVKTRKAKTAARKKFIYFFHEGNAMMKDLLGGKGAGLAEMTRMGIPVPPGFTITTEVCHLYNKNGKRLPKEIEKGIRESIRIVEKESGKGLGDPEKPLLVSVRSGAPISMPGMMETILNLGMNNLVLDGMIALSQNERWALDCYRRLLSMFGSTVMGVKKELFADALDAAKKRAGVEKDFQLSPWDLRTLIERYEEIIQRETGRGFPQDPWEQLRMAVGAVFDSWDGEKARIFRRERKIPETLGTAVNVQTMVFGNMGESSGTAVLFTRNHQTGENAVTGDFLPNAQGEDVVAGIRTPYHLDDLKEMNPALHVEILRIAKTLERHYRDVLDIECTYENGKLYLLQNRSAFPTSSADAVIKMAFDLWKEKKISREEAILKVSPDAVDTMLHARLDPELQEKIIPTEVGASYKILADPRTGEDYRIIATGTGVGKGAGVGQAVFFPREAEKLGKHDKKEVILVRPETNPDDVGGMVASQGIATSTGGATSHAALVARGFGIPCVVGCGGLDIDLDRKQITTDGMIIREGDSLTVDGTGGRVILGRAPLVKPREIVDEFATILKWADRARVLGVFANADTPKDAHLARNFGAEGIGLCRTEHMFMQEDRLPIVREMIMAKKEAERRELLKRLLPIQKEDFKGILQAMEGLPVTIRLLDPPLHEFLPKFEELLEQVTELHVRCGTKDEEVAEKQRLLEREQRLLERMLEFASSQMPEYQQTLRDLLQEVIQTCKVCSKTDEIRDKEALLKRVRELHEANPMLGLRVCRLGILYPEIYEMQVQAIFEAACELVKDGVKARPEVMIPGVGHLSEMRVTAELVHRLARQTMQAKGTTVPYKVGTMIELPRACVVADELAVHAEFFSFGTNDLTQTTFGYSRDDAEKSFVPAYLKQGILSENPFLSLDTTGVGELMKMAVAKGRRTRPDLKIGICGEHGGDPASIQFCHSLKLNYVSCSPYRVPVARQAAAHAALKEK